MSKAISLYAPILKSNIDIENRIIHGIAQIEDEPDHQGDVVDFDASREAFANWTSRNIREMHGPKAVGKCLHWEADPVKKAIHVKLKISKGAEDTWQKILDGTLSALSIGGHELSSQRQLNKKTGSTYNRIMKYLLTELSVVDSPANPKCVITAIHKSIVKSDVLSTLQGGSKTMPIKKAHLALRAVAKTLDDADEMFIIRKSDVELKNGVFLLKGEAVPGVISKADASDAGLMSDDDKTNGADMGGVDLEDHATNLANAHKDLCGMAGIDDHVGHYKDATKGDDEYGGDDSMGGDGGASQADGSGMQMSRRTGNLRKSGRYPSQRAIEKLVEDAVGSAVSGLAKKLDGLTASLGSGGVLAPRKENSEPGASIEKLFTPVGGAPIAPLEGGMEKRFIELEAEHTVMHKRAGELIAKKEARMKLTPEEEIEAATLSKSMGRNEVERSELRKKSRRDHRLKTQAGRPGASFRNKAPGRRSRRDSRTSRNRARRA